MTGEVAARIAALPDEEGRRLVEALLADVADYAGEACLDLIARAAEVAARAHAGQYRTSGEPYYLHPLQVARILSKYWLDPPTLAAAILHDTLEDTELVRTQLIAGFGEEVATLVDGVTKISKLKFSSVVEARAENLRKMILAMARDIRVILIKLADRLHNMRTLGAMRPDKQRRIAEETLEIYAPLAHRLGIDEIKSEFEDLAFQVIAPAEYRRVCALLESNAAERDAQLDKCVRTIREKLREMDVEADIQVRVKHPYSIWQKMKAERLGIDEIYDVAGVRLITRSLKDCYAALGAIHTLWKPVPGRLKDYIALPKPNMYQSIHTTVFALGSTALEVQIRTEQMHRTAEIGVAAHWRYKQGGGVDPAFEEKLTWLRDMMEWQRDVSDPHEFLEAMKLDLFASEVYVFTPAGQLVILPRGATPVDFAYAIHTEVGDTCVGAKVDGRMVPLRHVLRNGSIVEILTKEGHRPRPEWLKMVKTSKARNRIRHVLRQQERRKSAALGQLLLRQEFDKRGIDAAAVWSEPSRRDLLDKLDYPDVQTLWRAVGLGKLAASRVVAAIRPELFPPPSRTPSPATVVTPVDQPAGAGNALVNGAGRVRIEGAEGFPIRFAKCCNPIPGEPIVGLVTTGRGVSIHRRDCSNVEDLAYNPERRIAVSWEEGSTLLRAVKIRVHGRDRAGLFADTTTSIASVGVNILDGKMRVMEQDRFVGYFVLEIRHVDQLNAALEAIRKIEGVERVLRT